MRKIVLPPVFLLLLLLVFTFPRIVQSKPPTDHKPPYSSINSPCSDSDSKLSGSLIGTVRDSDGEPITGAKVVILQDYNHFLSTACDLEGRYSFDDIPQSRHYTMIIEAAGYKSQIHRIWVLANLTTTLDISLAIHSSTLFVGPGCDIYENLATTMHFEPSSSAPHHK